jgi:transposase-like protein
MCREVILEYVGTRSEKIGGIGKVVEIDESKLGKRKYHRGRFVRGQWVFGGVERGSGKTFLVAVPDRTAATLVAVIKEWIEPGTTVISDCWAAYRSLRNEGYEHRTVNHSITFVDEATGAHTNTIESTWRHMKAVMNPYNRKCSHMYCLAEYMLRKKCESEGRDPFTNFMDVVASMDWG